MGAEQKAKEEVVQEKQAPKSRGRPAGSKNNKPRIKRVPVKQQQQQQETAAKEKRSTTGLTFAKGLAAEAMML